MLTKAIRTARLLSGHLNGLVESLRQEIEIEPKNSLLNSNEITYVDYLVQKYSVEPLACDWGNKKIDDYEKQIPASQLPYDVLLVHGISQHDHRTFPQCTVVCYAPFTGDASLLEYQPTTSLLSLPKISITGNTLTFEIPGSVDNPEQTKKDLERHENFISQQINNINTDLAKHNADIKAIAERLVKERKNVLLKRSNLLESLNIPIKRTDSTQASLIIPMVKKIIIHKPSSSTADFVPDPAIDDATYQDILRMCHDLGIAMERRPSLYKDANGHIKNEEPLRDVFLVPLSLQFDSVTGETINNAGKTDILIRYMKKNAFVAECKFWGGAKMHQETIDQILRNLTWRDSKSAIIYFVDNKNLRHVLDKMNELTSQHPCYIQSAGNSEASWFNFHFHLPADKNLSVKLAILFFHFN